MLAYCFINNGVNRIKITLSENNCSVVINHQSPKTGTTNDAIAEVRKFLVNNASYLTSNKIVQISIEVNDRKGNTMQISTDRSYLVNHLRVLASSCKCQLDIQAGIHFIA